MSRGRFYQCNEVGIVEINVGIKTAKSDIEMSLILLGSETKRTLTVQDKDETKTRGGDGRNTAI